MDYSTFSQRQQAMLYERPNGGLRILPSVYAQISGHWLRANHVLQPIDTMNNGHLENCCKLLNESHGNLIDRCNVFLGKMHHHFGNVPEVQYSLEELCIALQKKKIGCQ